jgi:hypothetical protein
VPNKSSFMLGLDGNKSSFMLGLDGNEWNALGLITENRQTYLGNK